MKNVITLGKLIRLLLSSLPLLILLSVNMHTNTRNELTRLVMGTFFLVCVCKNIQGFHNSIQYVIMCLSISLTITHLICEVKILICKESSSKYANKIIQIAKHGNLNVLY